MIRMCVGVLQLPEHHPGQALHLYHAHAAGIYLLEPDSSSTCQTSLRRAHGTNYIETYRVQVLAPFPEGAPG